MPRAASRRGGGRASPPWALGPRACRRARLMRQAGGELPEDVSEHNKVLPSAPGGRRRRDVWVRRQQTQEVKKVHDAARPNKSGNFVPRERKKLGEYNKAGIPPHVEQVK